MARGSWRAGTAAGTVFLVALIVNLAVVYIADRRACAEGDGKFYIRIARALADGRGYVQDASPWPDQPTTGRMPGWPVLLALPAYLFPHTRDFDVLCYTGAFLNSGTAALLVLLTWKLFRDLAAAAGAGVVYAFCPIGAFLVSAGYSEPPTILVGVSAMLLAVQRRPWLQCAGYLIGGMTALFRSNLVILPLIAWGYYVWRYGRAGIYRKETRKLAAATLLFCLPITIWAVRNYRILGRFPVLSTVEGETLYGANNQHVASNLDVWGYWVFPDSIPGEEPKSQLARRMQEYELGRYYHDKAVRFVQENWAAFPRLMLGKMIRAFVPVPWSPKRASWIAFSFRWVLYAAFLLTFRRWAGREPWYEALLIGNLGVLLITTLVYYGTFRFTFLVEVLMIPLAAFGVLHWARERVMVLRANAGTRGNDSGGRQCDAASMS